MYLKISTPQYTLIVIIHMYVLKCVFYIVNTLLKKLTYIGMNVLKINNTKKSVIFNQIFIIFGAPHCILQISGSICYHFSSTWKPSLSILGSADLLKTNTFSCCQLENVSGFVFGLQLLGYFCWTLNSRLIFCLRWLILKILFQSFHCSPM